MRRLSVHEAQAARALQSLGATLTPAVARVLGPMPRSVCPDCQRDLQGQAGEVVICPRCREPVTAALPAVE